MLKKNCTTSCLLVMIDRCFMGSKRSDWHLLTNVHRLAVDVNVRLIIELRSSLVRLIAKKKKKKLPACLLFLHALVTKMLHRRSIHSEEQPLCRIKKKKKKKNTLVEGPHFHPKSLLSCRFTYILNLQHLNRSTRDAPSLTLRISKTQSSINLCYTYL